jgi:hypothetical protein
MKANELRIGNFILTHDPEHYYAPEDNWDGVEWKTSEVLEFSRTLHCVFVNEGESEFGKNYEDVEKATSIHSIKMLKPIPLTEEWLIRFGFTAKNKVDYESNCGILDLESTDAGFLFDSRLVIEHVHTLQNLYFALTGQELEFKQILIGDWETCEKKSPEQNPED